MNKKTNFSNQTLIEMGGGISKNKSLFKKAAILIGVFVFDTIIAVCTLGGALYYILIVR